ncbi:hypothetical protein DFH06DRAFT_580636 [Mycena polygramma]|nr:hypothetical protein DFH06DRAFT_580636 [Mycena polygramma]
MLSVTDLLTQIEELSSAIDVQKQVLKKLNAKRIDAWRNLNALRDPISRLPLELSSEIFVCCLPDSPRPDFGNTVTPTLLLGVCHRWSSIAISTPSLWNTIYSDCPLDAPNFDKLLEVWLGRAQSLPLSLHLRGRGSLDRVLPVMQRAFRVEDLELSPEDAWDFEGMNTQSKFSSLKNLRIVIRNTMSTAINARGSLEMLRAAPRLSSCEFEGMYYRRNETQPPELLVHPSLQHLGSGRPLWQDSDYDISRSRSSSVYILQYLTLPALKSLRISRLDITRDQFTSFLVRSSPPLQSLAMEIIPALAGLRIATHDYFRVIPSLTDLDLLCTDRSSFDTLVEALAAAPDILPALRCLTFRTRYTVWGYFQNPERWEHLLRMLTSRRFQSFRLIFVLSMEEHYPPDHVLVALRQLANEGMDLYVGYHDSSFL